MPPLFRLRIIASLLSLASSTALAIPAFPGAEGAGANAVGGRGGDVYHVTNTNASGAGSLADGLTVGVPGAGRTIVFDVSGYAHISGTLRVTASKITIAGQTAPGDGFGLKDGTFRVSGDDVVIRHLRFRDGNSADAIDLDSGSLNSIFDHCDAMLSNDENVSSFSSPPENMTWQWSVNAWGMESHSAGGLWDQNHATCHHSLWAHNHTRNPKARPSLLDWRNNVTFDWDIGFILGDSTTPANWNTNVVGNYFIAATSGKTRALEKGAFDRNGVPNFHVYLSNNRFDGNLNGLVDGTDTGYGMLSDQTKVEHLAAALVNPGVAVTTEDPLLAYKKVVSAAGPLRLDVDVAKPLRDELATILANELVAQTHHHVSSPAGTGATNGGFGALNSAAAPVDTDKDGMPDYYETALGWSSATDDHNTALASSGGVITGVTFFPTGTVAGYTRLEEYLHFLAIPHGALAKNVSGAPTSIAVDMRKFTSGFSASPTFTVANISGGAVVLSGAGNAIATFTPTLNYTGRVRFDFTVTDSAGSAWTQTCALVVTSNALPRAVKWVGDGAANVWSPSAANWSYNGVATTPSGDNLLFDDTGSQSPVVSVPNGVGNVFSSMTVNAAGNYTISAPTAGYLIGPLTKRGTGTLTISTTGTTNLNPTILEEGTLAVTSGLGLGASALTLAGGTYAPMIDNSPSTIAVTGNTTISVASTRSISSTWSGAGTVNLAIGNNTFSLTGNTSAFAGTFALGSSTGFFRLNGALGSAAATFDLGTSTADLLNRNGNATIPLGALTGGSGTTLSGASAAANPTTYEIGANGNSTTFAGAITNGLGTTAITKVGGGALTLTGTTSYTGATTVSVGDLIANGALGASAITVASGAKLRGAGSIAGAVTMQAGSQLSPGAASGAVGTLTLGTAGLNLQGATLSLQLSASPGGANDKVQLGGGTLALSGTNAITFTLTGGVLGAGTYDLIAGGVATTGGLANLSATFPSGARQTFALAVPVGKVQIVVTGDPATLTWNGATNGTWNGTDVNWSGGVPNTFFNFDAVVFDDTTANRSVTIASSVAPRSVLVNTALGYTLGGASLDGTGTLTKNGAGTLTLATTSANAFTGGVVLNAGTIVLDNDAANAGGLGTGPVTLNGGVISMHDDQTSYNDFTAALVVPAGATARINADSRVDVQGSLAGAGTLNFFIPYIRTTLFADWSAFTGTINVLSDAGGGDFRIGTSYAPAGYANASIVLAANVSLYFTGTLAQGAGTTIEIGELSGGSFANLRGGATGGRALTYRIGGKTPLGSTAAFLGNIAEQNTGTLTNIVKTGAGTWAIYSGTWNGGTTVEQGVLDISGLVTSAAATDVAAGATLRLDDGAIATDAVNIAAGATLYCGGGSAITGDLNNDGTATLAGDELIITGTFVNNGSFISTNGTLQIVGDAVNNGTLRLTGAASIIATGTFENNGLLDLLTTNAALPANFTNNGIVIANTERRILSVAKAGANFSCTVFGYTGHTFRLERADTLAGPWTAIGGTLAGLGAMLTFTDTGGAVGTARFYRVNVGP